MPRLVIDGRELEVEEGLNIIQAAARLGIEIPHFCYHPALSIVAQCRQCLVEVEGVPKMLPACNTFVRDGLVIKTNSERALKARRATVEFTLINHPLDCPICDKGGECPLQLTTVKHGPGYSRFEGPEEKKVRRKYFLSDKIMYDPNRCIMCTRCVRFTDEVTGTGELGFQGRGFRKKIVVFPGVPLDNELAGNVIDLCPVGALLSTDTLHEERVWYWRHTDTVCPLCSTGCNITVGVDPRKGRMARVRPRPNPDVNAYWICDRGRYGFKEVQGGERLKEPLKREGEELLPCSWDDALEAAARALEGAQRNGGVTLLLSPTLTNEELYVAKKMAKIAGFERVLALVSPPTEKKRFGLISDDPYPNCRGVSCLGLGGETRKAVVDHLLSRRTGALYVVGLDVVALAEQENEGARLREALSHLDALVVQDTSHSETVRLATVVLPGATPYEKEGTFTNDAGRIQLLRQAIPPPGEAMQDWEVIAALARRMGLEGLRYASPSEVMDEMAGRIAAFKGLSFTKIGSLGVATAAPDTT